MRHTKAGQTLSDRDRAFLVNPDSNRYCACGCGRRSDIVITARNEDGDPVRVGMAWDCARARRHQAKRAA